MSLMVGFENGDSFLHCAPQPSDQLVIPAGDFINTVELWTSSGYGIIDIRLTTHKGDVCSVD